MQEKKDQPGQGDLGGEKKQWPGDETGKQGDIGKKGGSGDVGREGDKSGQQPSTEKKL
jgi:hypothetical protein